MPIVTVQLLAGRTKEQKAELAKAITEAVVRIAKGRPEGTQVLFFDVDHENWASAGTLMSERSH